MEKTIRELIAEFQNEILSGDLLPDRAAEILTKLSALMGNINDEIRIRDVNYNKVLLEHYNKQETANRAKITAETTEEYDLKRIARDTKDLAKEMSGSLKYFLRGKEDEIRASRFI